LRALGASGLGLAFLAAPTPAQAGDAAAAEALFQAAKQLMAEKQFSEACPKFDASYKLDPTLGTLLNLADCYEKDGRVATAWATWNEALEMALRDGDKRAEFARTRREALVRRLPKIVINVENMVPGVEVLWDDSKLEPAVFGVPIPTDPAEHDLVVLRDDGVRLSEQRVRIESEGMRKEVTLDVGELDKKNPRKIVRKPLPPAPLVPSRNSQRLAGFVVGGLGAAAIVTAGAFEGVALAKKNAALESCVNKLCTTDGLAGINSAQNFAEAGQWIGVGGLVAFAVGTTLLVTAPTSPAPARAARPLVIAPWATRGSAGLIVGGAL
jgi:hypothetical protein